MLLKEWKLWFRSLPWLLSWFVVLIIIRPLIDNFYYLKEVSPFLSPLYIVGVLTPVLSIIAISRIPLPNYSRLDTIMRIYGFFIFISCFFLLIGDFFSMNSLEFSLKLSLPVFLYFFCRRLIRSRKDLQGVLFAFAISSVFVIALLTYELIFNPISVHLSRGLERIQGNFADVSNYAFYATCGVLIAGYFYFDKKAEWTFRSRVILFLFFFALSLLISINIHHTASYAVIVTLFLIFLVNNLKDHKGGAVFFILMSTVLVYAFGKEAIDENILPLIETDIQVYEGEKESEALLHGRVGRWMSFLDEFSESGVVSQFIGMPAGMDNPYKYISKGAHNDYLRVLMFTGYIGITTYLIFLGSVFMRALKRGTETRFLGLGAFAIISMYSVSTTPSLYAPLLYVLIPVISFLAIPGKGQPSK
jgi:O-antigen ligase